jgi:hypothetical protein
VGLDITAPIAPKIDWRPAGELHTLWRTLSPWYLGKRGANGNGGDGEGWLHIDDEAVSAVRHEDVFGGHDSGKADDRCPYLLFYHRTT